MTVDVTCGLRRIDQDHGAELRVGAGAASQRWPQLEAEVTISWRGSYGYVHAYLSGDAAIPVCRLRYLGSDTDRASRSTKPAPKPTTTRYLPDASPSGTPEQALDCALGRYLADPTAWIEPPKD